GDCCIFKEAPCFCGYWLCLVSMLEICVCWHLTLYGVHTWPFRLYRFDYRLIITFPY
uniref:Uncharacterized protein n=1 Tax=Aegilops tauschii subsp. strangulata TaxID=200361 RepID=A0A453I357_AEGTS